MEITQVKMLGEKVHITWQTRNGPEGETLTTHKLVGGEDPTPAFANAISDLRPDVVALMELPPEWFDPAKVVGMNVSHEDDGALEVSLSFKRTMRSGRVVGIATPKVRSRLDETTDGKAFMTEDMERRVMDVLRHAEEYVGGKRAQRDIEEETDDQEDAFE